MPHRRGAHCQDERCPDCGGKMLREGSYEYQLWRAKLSRAKDRSEARHGSSGPGDDRGQSL